MRIAAMIRTAALAVFTALASLASPAPPAAAQTPHPDAPFLKASVTVTGDIVRIGDLVANAGAVADVPIFRSPDLGQTGSVPAASVIDAVRVHHIIGLDTRGLAEVEVHHAGLLIAVKDIEDCILQAVAARYGLADTGKLAVALDGDLHPIEVEPSVTSALSVSRLIYDARTGRFDATLELPGSRAARRLPLHFTGTASETADAVVAAHDLAQGEIIRPEDVTLARRPKAELGTKPLGDVDEAQGLTAKHALHAGDVIRLGDVAKTELVARNGTVTMTYEVPGIVLSVVGKAVEAGGLGDTISVVNPQSKRTIQATVTGPDRVKVDALVPRMAAAAAQ
jgi:flagellar basal body P-ring formation protein FlgA